MMEAAASEERRNKSPFWGVPEAADYLGMKPDWVYRRAESGELAGAKFGNKWKFDPEDVKRFHAEEKARTAARRLAKRAGR
jgi:excisionase family DNA binding protein